MSNVEHYFENLLFYGHDIKGEPNKNALSKDVQEAVEECADYIKYVYGTRVYKTGKWVLTHPLQEDDEGAYVCSCCKSGSWEVLPTTWKACPWCGATMEVVEE